MKKLKLLFSSILISVFALLWGKMALAVIMPPEPSPNPEKVIVCHKTSSKKNPYVKIVIDWQGWINGHSKHEGDYLLSNPEENCQNNYPEPIPF